MKKKYRIEYLELDECRYIENDEFKVRSNENNVQESCTWDEMWDMVLADIDKLEAYEQNATGHCNNEEWADEFWDEERSVNDEDATWHGSKKGTGK